MIIAADPEVSVGRNGRFVHIPNILLAIGLVMLIFELRTRIGRFPAPKILPTPRKLIFEIEVSARLSLCLNRRVVEPLETIVRGS